MQTRDFPLKGGKVSLFHVPVSQYNFRSGNIAQFFNSYMSSIADLSELWRVYLNSRGLANVPYGLYTASADDAGAVTYSYKIGESFNYRDIGFEDTMPDFSIMRGGVYGAVKYDNQYRACFIGTK